MRFMRISPLQTDYDGRVHVMAVSDDRIVHCFLKPDSTTPAELKAILEKWHAGKWRIWKK